MSNLSVSGLGLNRKASNFWLGTRGVHLINPNQMPSFASAFSIKHWRYRYIFSAERPDEQLSFPEPGVFEILGLGHLEVVQFYNDAIQDWHERAGTSVREPGTTKRRRASETQAADPQCDSSCSRLTVSDFVAAARLKEKMQRLQRSFLAFAPMMSSILGLSDVGIKSAHSRVNEFHWRHPVDEFLDDIMQHYRLMGCELFFEPNWKTILGRLGNRTSSTRTP